MFYLDRRGDAAATTAAKYDSPPSIGEENFGWWLSHWKIAVSPRSRRSDGDHRSSGSSASMLSYIDSDDLSGGCTFAQEPPAGGRQDETCEKIEFRTSAQDDLDIELIERDAREMNNWSTSVTDDGYNARNESEVVRCSLKGLIRCQEYQVPRAPFFRCSSRMRRAPETEDSRTRLNYDPIDSERIGGTRSRTTPKLLTTCAKTRASFSPVIASLRQADDGFAAETRSSEDFDQDRDHCVRSTETVSSSRSSCDRLNSTWDDCNAPGTRLCSLGDTSGIQSNDCSSDTQSDASDTPMCLCDELAIASKDCVIDYENNRGTAVNEVASILEGLQNDPEKATVLLEEEDRFCDCRSSHDQLTRLALAIETDVEKEQEEAVVPAILDDPNNWVRQLRDKIELLQHSHKEIRGDIHGLRGDFQRDERKISDVTGDTTRLRGEIRELRHFDDLLTLIQGELARISRRNWPFVLGNNEPRAEVNLII